MKDFLCQNENVHFCSEEISSALLHCKNISKMNLSKQQLIKPLFIACTCTLCTCSSPKKDVSSTKDTNLGVLALSIHNYMYDFYTSWPISMVDKFKTCDGTVHGVYNKHPAMKLVLLLQ